ncbi:MAG: thiolase family protein [Chloroflexota bacterium]|nr:MAG: thiolase family protein [Chloroflexota bacterium]
MTERSAVILSAVRTPIGRFNGALATRSAIDLGSAAARAATERALIDPATIDETLFGVVVQAGLGQAPARQIALAAGVPPSVSATTINKVCGSSLKAVMLAAQAIRADDGDLFLCGGAESMSNAPYILPKARTGYRLGHGQVIDSVIADGLWCSHGNEHMGDAAERIAALHGVSRQEQDEFALSSHRKAVAAQESGAFRGEIVPVVVPGRDGSIAISVDEAPRPDTSLSALARLRPVFNSEGTVTAGNAPPLSDGAAAVVVASDRRARDLGAEPLARIVGYAQAAIEPGLIFAAPPLAIEALLARTKTALRDYQTIEINEAFSAQVLANHRVLNWDWDRFNVRGGAVALGHPLGATGARILTTLVHALRARGGGLGLCALCLGGGGAVALAIEV